MSTREPAGKKMEVGNDEGRGRRKQRNKYNEQTGEKTTKEKKEAKGCGEQTREQTINELTRWKEKNPEKAGEKHAQSKYDTGKEGADSHPKNDNQWAYEQHSKEEYTRKQRDRTREHKVDSEKVANTAKRGVKELLTNLKTNKQTK